MNDKSHRNGVRFWAQNLVSARVLALMLFFVLLYEVGTRLPHAKAVTVVATSATTPITAVAPPSVETPPRTTAKTEFVKMDAPKFDLGVRSPSAEARAPLQRTYQSGEAKDNQAKDPANDPTVLGIGDRLHLSIYEGLDRDEDRWKSTAAKGRPSAPAVELRTELSGEYVVDETGRITLPALGRFTAGNRAAGDVEEDIAQGYQKVLGRPASVLLNITERRPVFVLGNVATAGAAKFSPGMTVLHAVALAGGFGPTSGDVWQVVEVNREVEHMKFTMEQLQKLLVQRSVREFELLGTTPSKPKMLLETLSASAVDALVQTEISGRHDHVAARKQNEAVLAGLVAKAKEELAIAKTRIPLTQELEKLQERRASKLMALYDKGFVPELRITDAHVALAAAREQSQAAAALVVLAEQKVGTSHQALAMYKSQIQTELEVEVRELTQKIEQLVNERNIGLSKIKALSEASASPAAQNADTPATFELVRRTAQGMETKAVSATTELRAGDLITVRGGGGAYGTRGGPSKAAARERPDATVAARK